ncbi:MAG TPA: AAA family ATPase, partial [Longimicrobiales bacterium]|nr:AAA family ATPase [Longimicrobiales bacterium]
PPAGAAGFPWSVPALAGLDHVDLDRPVTFLVGENGSGKSTFLEALAVACWLPTVGAVSLRSDDTREAQSRLARTFRLVWTRRIHRGFFLRAEDFFGFIRGLRRQREELRRELERVDRDYAGASDLARTLAAGPHRSSLADMEARYGEDPDARSHGESFLDLFRARIVPGGLHLLDEPEAALSPQSQLGLIALLAEAVAQGAQFVIATHSPILLATPGAGILGFDGQPAEFVTYEELESVRLVRDFLEAPERFLRHLWPGEVAGT